MSMNSRDDIRYTHIIRSSSLHLLLYTTIPSTVPSLYSIANENYSRLSLFAHHRILCVTSLFRAVGARDDRLNDLTYTIYSRSHNNNHEIARGFPASSNPPPPATQSPAYHTRDAEDDDCAPRGEKQLLGEKRARA